MDRIDLSEPTRAALAKMLNDAAKTPEELSKVHGRIWDTYELQKDFEVEGFLAPYVKVIRKDDEQVGLLLFQHSPRVYWGFTPIRGLHRDRTDTLYAVLPPARVREFEEIEVIEDLWIRMNSDPDGRKIQPCELHMPHVEGSVALFKEDVVRLRDELNKILDTI